MREEAAGGREEERAQESGWVAVQFQFLAIHSSNEPWPLLVLLRIAGSLVKSLTFGNVSSYNLMYRVLESRTG